MNPSGDAQTNAASSTDKRSLAIAILTAVLVLSVMPDRAPAFAQVVAGATCDRPAVTMSHPDDPAPELAASTARGSGTAARAGGIEFSLASAETGWWLNVFFFVNNEWIPGRRMLPQGWAPRAYATEEECLRRKAFAERQCRDNPLTYPALWLCSPDQPLSEVPDFLRGHGC